MDIKMVNSWAIAEAVRILDKIEWKVPKKGYVLFETGYGPSGLPHIGTFGEVARVRMVMFAFSMLAPEIPTKLFCVSDDMDGMRKIPSNVPRQEELKAYIGQPLTKVFDPYSETTSYGAYMNAKLCSFLDSFGFEYEFISSSKCYQDGVYDKMLVKVAEKYDEIRQLVMKSLRDERRETYSPFMPICNKTGAVLEDGVISIDAVNHTVKYQNSLGEIFEQKFTGGGAKLQWKVDFGMRWAAFEVDYEMYGKDIFENEDLYRGVCEILGVNPPINYQYELFLDKDGKKISKSKGNGVTVDEWLRYAPPQTLGYYMYLKPKTAKRLYFDVIPRCVDEYIRYCKSYHTQTEEQKLENPLHYVHSGNVSRIDFDLSFALLINLASTCNPENDDIIWGFIAKYNANLTKGKHNFLDAMVRHAIVYYNDFVKINKKYRSPSPLERNAIQALVGNLQSVEHLPQSGDDLQNVIYKSASDANIDAKDFFKALYEVLLGLESGPRFGSFIELYGVENFIEYTRKMLQI